MQAHSIFLTPLVESKEPSETKLELCSSERNLTAINQGHFQKGDILLYLPLKAGMNFTQKLICCAQALKKRKHGHQEITHAAIFMGYEKEKTIHGKHQLAPKIGDVTGKGFRVGKLKADQPVLIFRARNPELGKLMVEEALTIKRSQRHLRWDCCVAIGMLCKRHKSPQDSKRHTDEIEISKNTTCSRFAVQLQSKALARLDQDEQAKFDLNISDLSTAKDLEAALHENPNYNMYISFGRKNSPEGTPYEIIQQEVEIQLDRLRLKAESSKDQRKNDKYVAAERRYTDLVTYLNSTDKLDDLEKAIHLCDHMEQVFAVNTGCGFRNTSASALEASRYHTGLFRSVATKYKQTLAHEMSLESKTERQSRKYISL